MIAPYGRGGRAGVRPAATWLRAGVCVASACGAHAAQPSGERPIVASFACNGGKTIHAVFASGPPPSVALTLSDGRKMQLPQVVSGSGARYANHDESFVFWNKGRTAFVEEAGHQTYSGCVQTK